MKTKNRSNLRSPQSLGRPCDLDNLNGWFRQEAEAIRETAVRAVILSVQERLDAFVSWPDRALLLWEGRDRSTKYHSYPASILREAQRIGIPLDGRVNGPAVAAYLIAGGKRPPRFGSTNRWTVHHLYSGKFPSVGQQQTLHAAYDGRHCTQSAGLVAVHPIADQVCDEFPFFAWLLRALAFKKFGYDPDTVFSSSPHDTYGFAGASCPILERTAPVSKAIVPTSASEGSRAS
jgi:hypothetical protein